MGRAGWRALVMIAVTGCAPGAATTGEGLDATVTIEDVGSVAQDSGAGPEDGGDSIMDAGHLDAHQADLGWDSPIDAGPSPTPDSGESASGCGRSPGANDRTWTIPHDGRDRTFEVHLPPAYDAQVATPVVLDLHGRAFTAQAQSELSGMNVVADQEGFIVVHPQGVGRTWNGGVCCGEASRDNIDDVGFINAVLDRLEQELCIDTQRVYATGMSNGAFLAHRLACELSERVAAIAPVAGVMGLASCTPSRPVPVLHFHGDADQVVRYDGYAGYLSAADSSEGWAQRNGCDAASQPSFALDDVRCEQWGSCTGAATVQLCTVQGGGHTWPGGMPLPLLGHTTQTISASQMAWSFFEAHPLVDN